MPTREEIAEARQHARQFLHGPSIRIILAALDEALDVVVNLRNEVMLSDRKRLAKAALERSEDTLHRNGRL